jgi:hypothetical protein
MASGDPSGAAKLIVAGSPPCRCKDIGLGSEPPDWSYGPIMIRLSRFREVARYGDLRILDDCSAQRAAKRLLLADTGLNLDSSGTLSRSDVLYLATRYNGQRGSNNANLEKRLADAVYKEPVYNLGAAIHLAQ